MYIFNAKKGRGKTEFCGAPLGLCQRSWEIEGYDKARKYRQKYKAMRESLSVMATSITYQR